MDSPHFVTEDGDEVRISGNYPFESEVRIQAKLSNGKKLRLRIPGFCHDDRISDTVHFHKAGEMWESDGTGFLSVTVVFSLPFQLQSGEKDCQGRYCIFRGPVLLGYDNGENPEVFLKDIPTLSLEQLRNASVQVQKDGKLEIAISVGKKLLKLHDFYSLGQSGSWYTTWFYQKP